MTPFGASRTTHSTETPFSRYGTPILPTIYSPNSERYPLRAGVAARSSTMTESTAMRFSSDIKSLLPCAEKRRKRRKPAPKQSIFGSLRSERLFPLRCSYLSIFLRKKQGKARRYEKLSHGCRVCRSARSTKKGADVFRLLRCSLCGFFVDEGGLVAVHHAPFGDDDLLYVVLGRDVVHDVRHQPFDDRPQPSCPRL